MVYVYKYILKEKFQYIIILCNCKINKSNKKMNNFNKTERRLWNKSNQEFDMELPPDESQKRYEEYLFNLHLNNQLSKIVKKKDKHEEELQKLENGFNLYVNGAHKKQEKYTPRYTTATKSSSMTNSTSSSKKFSTKLNFEFLSDSRSPSTTPNTSRTPSTTSRKKWVNSSFIFKTSDGYEIKINSPNRYNHQANESSSNQSNECDYSDDFESDEEQEGNKSSSSKDLIENVKFSDQESSDNETKQDNKKLVNYELTKNDIKLLRQSFLELNDSIKSDESLNKKEIDTPPPEEIDSDLENTIKNSKSKPSDICNLILEKAVFLKRRDRENLVEFLSKIDEK